VYPQHLPDCLGVLEQPHDCDVVSLEIPVVSPNNLNSEPHHKTEEILKSELTILFSFM